MGAEAVVLFKPELAKKYPWIRKSSMQLASKHRYIAAQFIALLTMTFGSKMLQMPTKWQNYFVQK